MSVLLWYVFSNYLIGKNNGFFSIVGPHVNLELKFLFG